MDRPNNKSDILYFFTILILLVMAAFNLFDRLGYFPIYSWDEARHGVSAYEMIKNNNYIVNTYRDKIDYWNLKPLLSFWAIIAGYKIAGFNALGLRLFSAIFAMLTIIMVTVFVCKKYGKVASIISMVVLSTCTQFLINHSARTGDADSLFVFLFTIANLSLLLWNKNIKWLYVSGLAFAFAFLTKSWHSGNIAIIMVLYLFFTGKYKQLSFKNWFFLGMCMFLPILIWGVFRYQYDGLKFFKEMILYDLLQRSSTTIEGHVGGVLYYVSILLRFFSFWIMILCPLVLLFFLKRNFSIKKLISSKKKNDMIGVCLWVLVPFLLFTVAKTKIRWYILPVYPALSIIVGALASKFLMKGKWIPRVILILSILFVSVNYEWDIDKYLSHPLPDLKQSLIEKITKKTETKGDSLYIYHPSSTANWLQSEVLTAELADDLHVENGGLNEFLKAKNALLMIPKKLCNVQLISSNQLKVITSNQWGYLVYKNS
ncbi:ArnT family glycosyltransferase [Neobacillus ginsengisoli]|uniref:4-amino-4-deoxy-L-arabinose transferase-like glycosyltransferase n=1 Tax=Neobacillus ginsengisoli TaxID=904295 RepID=A0ABT9XNQ1_9BACI|nr:glycosyltransferase family 39 protein [Neobacillus ginsengisoli]MDQ0197180.1 4-amino-4-deoxy-L-arabinose transferase-like glycosyltransferase [Neobacillus ginsengisoli]